MTAPAPAPAPAPAAPAGVIRGYLLITVGFNLAVSLIWGVDTLFKLAAGLDLFQVMLTNAAFTLGMMAFEIPTGVVADTVGRRVSLLLCIGTLVVTTLLYLMAARLGWGFWAFAVISAFLGLGYTFYSGAVEAWVVDGLRATGYDGPVERVLARGQMAFGVAMLVGTVSGGLLGQADLGLPYVARAVVLLPVLWYAWRRMAEVGFTPRTLEWRRVPAEMRRVFVRGLRFGLEHPVVRPLMLASLVAMSFMIFGFYSWQRYFLDLLGRELVWVNGVVSSLVGLSMIVGNALVAAAGRLRVPRTGLLMGSVAVQAGAVVLCGLLTDFYLVVGLYLVYCVALGVAGPVKQAYLNDRIPSAERATIISLDSFFANVGGAAGQSGWGLVARARSIGDAWVGAGASLLLGLPLYWLARRGERR